MGYIIWKGVKSTEINGLLICQLPPITKPQMRVSETIISGRDGSTIEELGYEPYDKTVSIGLRGEFDIDEVIKYFTGEGEIVFSSEPDKVYRARIHAKIDYIRLLRYRQANVVFRVQPYKYAYNEGVCVPETSEIGCATVILKTDDAYKLKNIKICGQTEQDGEPTPTAPAKLYSIGESGSITVKVADGNTVKQTVTASIPRLAGIKVSDQNLATYTDNNEQMWCADEIDFNKGVYIKRIHKFTPTLNSGGGYNEVGTYARASVYFANNVSVNTPNGMCNIASMIGDYTLNTLHFYTQNMQLWLFAPISELTERTANGVVNWFVNKGAEFLYILKTPIETALTDEEIAQYQSIQLENPNTVITNDELAFMKIEYIKPFEIINKGLETSKPKMTITGSGTVAISVNGVDVFEYTFPSGESQVVIDSEKEDAYLGNVLKNRNMNGEFPILQSGNNKIGWTGNVQNIVVEVRTRWL
jgi:predicted phage tail component-like protein